MNARLNSPDLPVVAATTAEPAASSAMPVLDSRLLLNGGREVLIRHGDECYRLRHTRNDKLILTK
ncbi:hemin uptake protein HemP [Lysobacter brunescens]|uniref:Hemin uptake protein HemP n=1 Tax=Lysobacter brunescens TaxID=262323 RepID=A0ABW2YBH3_9GAMM